MVEGSGSSLEQQIISIEQDLAQKREALREQQQELPHDKEMLHSVVREKIQAATPQVTPPSSSTTTTVIPPELHQKIQALVNLAFTKSIDEAIKEAKMSNNAAFIDAFHDLLVDELYKVLIERGKLKEM